MSKPKQVSINKILHQCEELTPRQKNLWIVTDYSDTLIEALEKLTSVTAVDNSKPLVWIKKHNTDDIKYIHFNHSHKRKCLGRDDDIRYLNKNEFKDEFNYVSKDEFIKYVSLVLPQKTSKKSIISQSSLVDRSERVNWKISKKNKEFLQTLIPESRKTVMFISSLLDYIEDNPSIGFDVIRRMRGNTQC